MDESFDFIFMDIDKEGLSAGPAPLPPPAEDRGLLFTDNVGFAAAAPFNEEIFKSGDWRTVHLLSFLPSHSPGTGRPLPGP